MKATHSTFSLKSIYIDFREITKARLAISVVFSSVAGFMLGIYDLHSLDWMVLLKLAVGGYCMVGASNAYNQVIEKDLDALMDRTKNRPVPAGRMSPPIALVIASFLTIVGISLLYTINPKTAMFGAISIFLYTSIYTPLKTMTSLSVFVGAFPGAIPFMLGWVAATGEFGIEAGTLFLIQFFWQFPHFWAIAWLGNDDYVKAGFKMLPSGGKTLRTSIQILTYTMFLLPIGLMPYVYGMAGSTSAIIIFVCGLLFLIPAWLLVKKGDNKSALMLMFSSFFYLPIVQLALLFDKL